MDKHLDEIIRWNFKNFLKLFNKEKYFKNREKMIFIPAEESFLLYFGTQNLLFLEYCFLEAIVFFEMFPKPRCIQVLFPLRKLLNNLPLGNIP